MLLECMYLKYNQSIKYFIQNTITVFSTSYQIQSKYDVPHTEYQVPHTEQNIGST